MALCAIHRAGVVPNIIRSALSEAEMKVENKVTVDRHE